MATRWNLTFDMLLSFAVQYRGAIEQMTSECKNDLRQYELTEEEWAITSELSGSLKVRVTRHPCCAAAFVLFLLIVVNATDPQRCQLVLLACKF